MKFINNVNEYQSMHQHSDGFFIISPRNYNFIKNNLDCQICGYLLTQNDDVYVKKFNCCIKCGLKWAELNRDSWLDGWRPDSNEIKDEILQRKKSLININV
jgi:hypothetical protein